MEMRQPNRKAPFIFRLGVILACVLLCTVHLTGGLYARYSSSFSGDDGARVAKFDITSGFSGSVSEELKLNFYDPDALSDEVLISVSSKSEVTVSYDVIVTMPSPAASSDYAWLTVTLDGKSPTSLDSVNGIYTFSGVEAIAFNDHSEKQDTILFAIKYDYHGAPPSGLADIAGQVLIIVRAEQLD